MDIEPEIFAYYVVGNTPAKDLTEGCTVPDDVSILLLGCGDIRHILYTVHTLYTNGIHPKEPIKFHLNDIHVGILARAVLLLYIVNKIDPKNEEDMKFLWAIWYECFLAKKHAQRLSQILQELCDNKCIDFLIHNESTDNVKGVLNDWAKRTVPADQLFSKRERFLKLYYGFQNYKYPEDPIADLLSRFSEQHPMFSSDKTLLEHCYNEIKLHVKFGVTKINANSEMTCEMLKTEFTGNPTFCIPGSQDYCTDADGSPFLTYDCDLSRYDGDKHSIVSLCLDSLSLWVSRYQKSIKSGCRPSYTLWLGDAFHVCYKGFTPDLRFDFIHTSNLAEHVGFVNILVSCEKRLKRNNGILTTEIFGLFHGYTSMNDFFEKCLGFPPSLFPSVLGLHLADDLELGTESLMRIGDFVSADMITLRWRIAREFDPIIYSDPDEIGEAIMALLERGVPDHQSLSDKYYRNQIKIKIQFKTTQSVIMGRTMSICNTNCHRSLHDIMRQNEFFCKSYEDYIVRQPVESEDKKMMADIYESEIDYTVKFCMDPELCVGKFNISYKDDTKTCVQIEFKSEKSSVERSCQLSCPVSLSDYNVKVRRKAGTVSCVLKKDMSLISGERVMPFRELVSDLRIVPDYVNSERNERLLHEVHIHRVFPQKDPTECDSENARPMLLLREILHKIYRLFSTDSQARTIRIICKEPVSNLEDFVLMFSMDAFKVVHGLPTLFVKWIDFDQLRAEVRKNKTTESDVLKAIGESGSPGHVYNLSKMTANYPTAFAVLKNIMMINTLRCKQNNCPGQTVQWKNSFIRPRYPFMLYAVHYWIALGIQASRYSDPLEPILQVITGEYARRIDSFRQLCHMLMNQLREEHCIRQFEQRCACCDKLGCFLKACARCHKSTYCDKDCQRKDWKNHKKSCKQMSSK